MSRFERNFFHASTQEAGVTLIELMITLAIGVALTSAISSTILNVQKAQAISAEEFGRFLLATDLHNKIHNQSKISITGLETCLSTSGYVDCQHLQSKSIIITTKDGKNITNSFYDKNFQLVPDSSKASYNLVGEGTPYCLYGTDCDLAAYVRISLKMYFTKSHQFYTEFISGITQLNSYGNSFDGCEGPNNKMYNGYGFPWLVSTIKDSNFQCNFERIKIDGVPGLNGKPVYQDTSGEVIQDKWW